MGKGGSSMDPTIQQIVQARQPLNKNLSNWLDYLAGTQNFSTAQFPQSMTAPRSTFENAYLSALPSYLGQQVAGSGINIPGMITPGQMTYLSGVPQPGSATAGAADWTSWQNPFVGMNIQMPTDLSQFGKPVFRPNEAGSAGAQGTIGYMGYLNPSSSSSSSSSNSNDTTHPRTESTALSSTDANQLAASAMTSSSSSDPSQMFQNILGIPLSQAVRITDPTALQKFNQLAAVTGVTSSPIAGMSPGEWFFNTMNQQLRQAGKQPMATPDAQAAQTFINQLNSQGTAGGGPSIQFDWTTGYGQRSDGVGFGAQGYYTGGNPNVGTPLQQLAQQQQTTPTPQTSSTSVQAQPMPDVTALSTMTGVNPQPQITAAPKPNNPPVSGPTSNVTGPETRPPVTGGGVVTPPSSGATGRNENLGNKNAEVVSPTLPNPPVAPGTGTPVAVPPPTQTGPLSRSENVPPESREGITPNPANFNFDLMGGGPLYGQAGSALMNLLGSGNPINFMPQYNAATKVMDFNAQQGAADAMQGMLAGGLRNSSAAAQSIGNITQQLQNQKNLTLAQLMQSSLESAAGRQQAAIPQLFGAGSTLESALQGRYGQNLTANQQQFAQQVGAGQFGLQRADLLNQIMQGAQGDISQRLATLAGTGYQTTQEQQSALNQAYQEWVRTQNAWLNPMLGLATNTPGTQSQSSDATGMISGGAAGVSAIISALIA